MEEQQKKKKGSVGTILGIVLCVIFIPIILINLTLIIQTYTTPGHLPGIFGVKPAIVLSGSMSPVFETDALVFVKETPTEDLKVDDVICFLTDGSAITHRIVAVNDVEGQITYTTKGDANNTEDAQTVTPEQVEGVYIGQIPGLGGVAIFMQTTTGMILFIVCPLLLYVGWDIFRRRQESKKEKKRSEALAAELAALKEKEQADNTQP